MTAETITPATALGNSRDQKWGGNRDRGHSCGSEACTDGCGDQIARRVWVHHGQEYTEPPVAMVVDAILRHVYGTTPEPAAHHCELPNNLRRFFAVPELDVEAVWRDLHAPLLAFIARRVSDRDSAEDILQEVMLRLHRHAGGPIQASAVGGWIHEIARNAIIDHYRRAVVRRERPAGPDIELDRPTPALPEPGPAELRAELAACLEPLLAQLPPIYRDALRLTDLDGLTQADAAARVGLSTSGMKTRVQRARAQLKALFARCCEIELDRRGGVIDYQPNNGACDCRTSTQRAEQLDSALASRRLIAGDDRHRPS